MAKTAIIIANDHPLFRRGIRIVLEEAGKFDILGEAENCQQVTELILKPVPHLVILDLNMPDDYQDGSSTLTLIYSESAATLF